MGVMSRVALEEACDWLVSHQNRDGGWGSPSNPTCSTMAVYAIGEGPVFERGLRWLLHQQEGDGSWRWGYLGGPLTRLQSGLLAYNRSGACPTAMSLITLLWVRSEARREVERGCDWLARHMHEYPVYDLGLSVGALALASAQYSTSTWKNALEEGVTRILGEQQEDGSWHVHSLAQYFPWLESALVLSPTYITAEVLSGLILGTRVTNTGQQAIEEGVRYLLERQNPDGGWGHSSSNVEDTAYVVFLASIAKLFNIRETRLIHAAQKGVEWLLDKQGEDGDWPGDWRHTRVFNTSFGGLALRSTVEAGF